MYSVPTETYKQQQMCVCCNLDIAKKKRSRSEQQEREYRATEICNIQNNKYIEREREQTREMVLEYLSWVYYAKKNKDFLCWSCKD